MHGETIATYLSKKKEVKEEKRQQRTRKQKA
jgi:hypothetical protein